MAGQLLPLWSDMLRHDLQADRRIKAAVGLGHLRNALAVPVLTEAMQDRDPGVRVAAVEALVRIADPQCREPLLAATRDPRLRAVALDALAAIRAPEAAALAETCLAEINIDTRCAAIRTYGALNMPGAYDRLLPLLDAPNRDVRLAAIQGLAALGDARAAPPLLARLGDEFEAAERGALLDALGKFHDPRVADALLALLGRDEGYVLRDRIIAALKAITGQNFGDDVAKWQAWWRERQP